MPIRIIVTGSTGLAGSEVVRQAILDDGISEITALVRRPLSIQHPKLKIVLHDNYRDYSSLTTVFAAHDACLWCLGISQTQVKEDEYIRITYRPHQGKGGKQPEAPPIQAADHSASGRDHPRACEGGPAFFEKVLTPIYPILGFLFPSLTIDSVELARAMLYLVKSGSGKTTLENKALKRAAGMAREGGIFGGYRD